MKKGILVYHPTGNQNVRALLHALERKNMLHSYHTTIATFKCAYYYKLFSIKWLSKFKRRTYFDSIRNKTILYPFLEMLLMMGVRRYKNVSLSGSVINKLLAYDVAKYVSKKGNKHIRGVFSFPFGSLPIFQIAKKNNILCFYEQTTGYYKELRSITTYEKQINSEWASSITIYEETQDTLNKLDEELRLADCIIVASSYIKETLVKNGYGSDKIKIIPYGFPAVRLKVYTSLYNRKIKMLFAGNLSQLKGLSYMFDAVEAFPDKIELYLAGSIADKECTVLMEHIKKHHYIGVISHEELLNEMYKSDILIFPSLCDGFGMVISEAMSQGIPVIASCNSGGPDIIKHGFNGWLVPYASSSSIVDVINSILENPDIISVVGKNALKTALERPWSEYEEEISTLLNTFNTDKLNDLNR